MFEFAWPWLGLLLPLPLLVRLFWPGSGRAEPTGEQRETLLHPHLAWLEQSFSARRPKMTLANWWYVLVKALLWLMLVLALMRPQWLEPYTETQRQGRDLMLVVDASHSMNALDFTKSGREISRMSVLKGVMDEFIAERTEDRVGLVVFGSQAFMLAPLTYDRDAVRAQLVDMVPGIAGQGTAIGDAIGLAVKKLRDRPPGSRVALLVADGENTTGIIPPLAAAQLAAAEGVRLYGVGVGSNRDLVPIYEQGKRVMRDDLGLDEQLMQQMARMTGGDYFRATDAQGLREIYQRIDALEQSVAESRTVMIPHSLHQWPLVLGLFCLIALGLFPEGRLRLPLWRSHA